MYIILCDLYHHAVIVFCFFLSQSDVKLMIARCSNTVSNFHFLSVVVSMVTILWFVWQTKINYFEDLKENLHYVV